MHRIAMIWSVSSEAMLLLSATAASPLVDSPLVDRPTESPAQSTEPTAEPLAKSAEPTAESPAEPTELIAESPTEPTLSFLPSVLRSAPSDKSFAQ